MDTDFFVLKASFKTIRKMAFPNSLAISMFLVLSYLADFDLVFTLGMALFASVHILPSFIAISQYLYYNYKMVVMINANEIHINDRIINKNEVESVVLRISSTHLVGSYFSPIDKCNFFLITLKTGEKIYITSLLYYDFQKILDSFSAYNCIVKKGLPFIY